MIERTRSDLSVLTLAVLGLFLTFANCWAGQWYPGIIHSHTIFSDGNNSPAKLAAIVQSELTKVRNDGKCFMIVTDHYDGISKDPEAFFVYTSAVRNTSIPGKFIAIPGLELGSKWRPEPDTVADAHILAIGCLPEDYPKIFDPCYDKNPGLGLPLIEKFDFQQQIINAILDAKMLPIAAHPSQLLIGGTTVARRDNRFNMNANYAGLRGVEMYNVLGPGQEEEAFQFYLRLLSEGLAIFVTSGSDYHGTTGSTIPEQLLGSLERVTWVYAESLTEDAILQAIAEGKTYAANCGARFLDFLSSEGQNPGFSVIGVDRPIIRATAFLSANQVELIVYRDGNEICHQKQKGNSANKQSYSLTGYFDGFEKGWLDPDETSLGVRSYVIRVIANKKGVTRTVLVTSPIRLRLRPPGASAAFFDAIKAGSVQRVAEFLRDDPSLANERDWRKIPEDEEISYHSSRPLALSIACAREDPTIVHLLLDAGASPDDYLGPGEPGPLMNAVCTGNIATADLLLQHGADININTDGNTPLHWAISCKHTNLARFLIEHGADVNATDDNGTRPLTKAKRVGLQEIVDLLLAHGAKE